MHITFARAATLATLLFVAGIGLAAHHGSAEYDTTREITVTGTVKEWRWTNPHTWVVLTVPASGGRTEEWNGEGPPLQWAAERGWSERTLKSGEVVELVLYPGRAQSRLGLVKRIKPANRDALIVSRPWLDK
jgi:hypothetical protein